MRKDAAKKQMYSLSFVAAITRDQVLATEIIEGPYDATLFEEVVFKILDHLRSSELHRARTIFLLMDNAVIHHHSEVLRTCQRYKANVLFNAQYSPWLNPVEQLFNQVKRRLLKKQVHTK
jgi:hypothetical protein